MTTEPSTGGSGRPSVFISYSREDSSTADLLTQRLKDAGVHVWLDRQNLLPGNDWHEAIERNLRASDYVIVLLSAGALASKYFRDEVISPNSMRELSDRSITVIPVLLDNTVLPDAIRRLNYIDLRQNPQQAVDDLVSVFKSTPDNRLFYAVGTRIREPHSGPANRPWA